MSKALLLLLAVCGTMHADTLRIHYSIRGAGKDIIVDANSSDDARYTRGHVPDAVVMGVRRVRK
jgi:hypothetical protein